jgi:hypothetical protein
MIAVPSGGTMALLLRAGTRRQFENTAEPFKGTNTVLITDEKDLVQLLEDGTTVTVPMERTDRIPHAEMMETEIRFDGASYWILLHKELYRATLPEPVWGYGARTVPGGVYSGGLRVGVKAEVGPKP